MENRVERAAEFHGLGCNCAQAVTRAYADVMGIDEDRAAAIAAPFGSGMGGTRGVCGAVSAMLMVLGGAQGDIGTEGKAGRKEIYAKATEMMREFDEAAGSHICGELLALPKEGAQFCRKNCVEYVRLAAGLLEKYL